MKIDSTKILKLAAANGPGFHGLEKSARTYREVRFPGARLNE
jgi:hypothetical protein